MSSSPLSKEEHLVSSSSSTSASVPVSPKNEDVKQQLPSKQPTRKEQKQKLESQIENPFAKKEEAEGEEGNTFCAKQLIAIAAIGFFTAGVIQVSAHDASVVDFFYERTLNETVNVSNPSRKSPNRIITINKPYYDDVSTSIFFDGYLCTDGSCIDLHDDQWACEHMVDEIARTRVLSLACGVLMLLACLFTAFALIVRGLARLFNFVAHKTFRKKIFIDFSNTTQQQTLCFRVLKRVQDVLLIVGLMMMFALSGFAIFIIFACINLVEEPMCPGMMHTPYNRSLKSMENFSYGRALHLVIGSCAISLVLNGLFLLWIVTFVCSKICCAPAGKNKKGFCDDDDADDDELDDEEFYEQELDRYRKQQEENMKQMKEIQIHEQLSPSAGREEM
jgi:uncharacterized membrane protein YqhA